MKARKTNMKHWGIRKSLSLLLVLTMVMGLFTACGKKDNNDEGKDKDNTANESVKGNEEVSNEPIKIDWFLYPSYGQPDTESENVKMVEERYNAKFNFWFLDSNKEDTLNIKLASGEMPDIMRIKWHQVKQYVKQGILAEIPEETIRKYAPHYAEYVDKYDEGLAWMKGKVDGKLYAFPKINLNGTYPTSLIWRQDWLDKLGITKMPETLEEFEAALYKISNDDPDGDGEKNTYGISDTAIPSVFAAYGIFTPKLTEAKISTMIVDGKPVIADIQPEAKEALKLLAKWYKDGVIDPEFVTKENTGGYWALSQAFMNGRLGITGGAMFYHYMPETVTGTAGKCYSETLKVNPDIKMSFGVPPVGPDGKSGTASWGAMGEGIGITTKAAKDPKKVELLLKMLDDAYNEENIEYTKTVMYGKEGVDYKIENGKLSRLNNDMKELNKKGIVVFPGSVVVQKEVNSGLYEFADKVASYDSITNSGLPVGDATEKYGAQLSTLKQEAYMEIITGVKDIDYFDEFVKKFNKSGGEEIQKEIEEIYNSLK
jgi:putative aldouronate transport system substrate-binding protein